ncbi:MAG: AbrB/MazE/SpoVT family DNA-binding domain-containing protein [Roseiarcus sp.]|jgi:AbrB family looped-hinge helix DNA binding protein
MDSYPATLSSKGQITLPAEVRALWRLQPGDQVEFFQDHLGNWHVRPLTAGPLDFLKHLPPRARLAGVTSDEDAIARAVIERNMPPARRKATG